MEETLQEQILARPDDDGPRLVYADWLIEREDPRGTFIHDQVRLASLDETHPDWVPLHARSERALLQHGEAWARPLREAYAQEDGPLELSWRRGWVEGVEVDTDHPAPLEPLAALTPLRAVALSSSGSLAERDLQHVLPLRPRELGLHIYSSSPVASPVRALQRVDWPLDTLDLTGTHLNPQASQALRELLERHPVRSLLQRDRLMGGTDLHRLLDVPALRSLQHLELSCALDEATVERLAQLPCPTLSLWLRGVPLHDVYGVALLLERKPLRALRLAGQWEMPELDWLLQSPGLLSIRHLSLPGWFRKRGGPGLRKLAAVPFEGLARLDLSAAVFGPGDLQALLSSPHLTQLVSLGLSDSYAGDEIVTALLDSSLTRLTELDLSACDLSDRGVKQLASWPGLAHVTRLVLSGNPGLRSAGFRALMDSPWFQPTEFECAVPALAPKGRMRRPRLSELEERFGAALRR